MRLQQQTFVIDVCYTLSLAAVCYTTVLSGLASARTDNTLLFAATSQDGRPFGWVCDGAQCFHKVARALLAGLGVPLHVLHGAGCLVGRLSSCIAVCFTV